MRPPRGRFGGGRDGGGRGRFGGGGGRFGGGGGRFGGGGGRFGGGGRGNFRDEGPPSEVVEVATFVHACEGDAVTKLTNYDRIPYFNAPIYLQNKTQIGKVDEIFGPINESLFSIKMMEGIVATSYNAGDKFYIDPAKLLPLSRFVTQPKGQTQAGRGGRGGRSGRGGGGFRGRGPPQGRGGPGGFRARGRSSGGFRGRGGRF